MDVLTLYPFDDDAEWLMRYCKLSVHKGRCNVGEQDHPFTQLFDTFKAPQRTGTDESPDSDCVAECFIPASGACKLLISWPGEGRLSRNFGKGLVLEGVCDDGPFRLNSPEYYASAVSKHAEYPGWAIASPVNCFLAISYGDKRPIASVEALINNFDFEHGNVRLDGSTKQSETLRVQAGEVTLDFVHRRNRCQLRRLVDAGLLETTAFVTYEFRPWLDAAENDLVGFVDHVATICSYVAGQHTGVAVIAFRDLQGRPVKRIIRDPVESKFRPATALRTLNDEQGLPQFFRESFAEHCRMQKSELWRRLPSAYACIEDPPYLEQKYAALMACVELFIRNCLVEHGMTEPDAESKLLPELVSAARRVLRWDVPKHYTEGERYRTARNAAGHGGSMPHDPRQVRSDFDKWKLFLMRRLFMRLGFTGKVASPKGGWASSSPVGEFSKEHNAF
jgi:hypothetical protein